jgi:hypothetical protein
MSVNAATRTADVTASSTRMQVVTKADADLPGGVTRGLLCNTAGTANLTDAEGNLCANFPLQQGYNPIQVMQVRTGGTADEIWALY